MNSQAKDLARHWFGELWIRRDPSAIAALMHPEAVGHTEGGTVRGPEEMRAQLHAPFIDAFPDLQVEIDGIIAEGDEAVVRWTAQGTHTAPLGPLPASLRKVCFSGMTWLVFKDGKVVGGWDRWNMSGLLAYLSTGTTTPTVQAA